MKATITEALIKRLSQAKQRAEVWDDKLPSFFIQIRDSGSATYYVRYTPLTGGKKRTLRLGEAAILTLPEARQLARKKLAQVLEGKDPASEQAALRACPTLAEAVREHYLPHIKHTKKKSWETDETLLRCHVLPCFGHKTLATISQNDIQKLMDKMRQNGKGGAPKGRSRIQQRAGAGYAPGTCNRVRRVLRYLFNLAIDTWKLPGVTHNPAKKIREYDDSGRQTFLNTEEIGRLFDAGKPRPGMQNPHTLLIVMLLVLTGVRRSNALTAEWQEFDESRGLWNLPASKTKSGKPQSIQLPQEVLSLLALLPARGQGVYLFPNPQTGKPYRAIYASWNTMRTQAGLAHVRMHDLRHTFASLLINGGASLFMVQTALGHSDPKVTMRYAHLAEATQRQAIQAAALQVPCNLTSRMPGLSA